MWDCRQRARRTRQDLQFIYWFYRTIDCRATTLHLYLRPCTASRRPSHTHMIVIKCHWLFAKVDNKRDASVTSAELGSFPTFFSIFFCTISRERGRKKCAGEWKTNIAIFVSFYPFSECFASTSIFANSWSGFVLLATVSITLKHYYLHCKTHDERIHHGILYGGGCSPVLRYWLSSLPPSAFASIVDGIWYCAAHHVHQKSFECSCRSVLRRVFSTLFLFSILFLHRLCRHDLYICCAPSMV